MPGASDVDHLRKPASTAWRSTTSALCASLVGIGLARFAYTPLLPAIIEAHWFAAPDAAYLGAGNLSGYMVGALLAAPMAARASASAVLRAMMLFAACTFFACAWPVNFAWFFAWRFASGFSGGALMVLAAPTVLAHIPESRRGLASGIIFMGIGLGIVASGTLVPLLLHQGLTLTWIGLGTLALILTLVAWTGWPRLDVRISATRHQGRHLYPSAPLRALYAGYALNALGLVPHMIFLVDFITRGLGQGLDAGAEYWVLFGLGAIIGPVLSGHIADRIGFGPALRVAYVIQAVAVALLAFSPGSLSLIISSLVVGAFTPGIVPLVLGRVHELLRHHPAAQRGAWSKATTSFAISQALAAYGMSFLLIRSGGDYLLLFGLSAGALVLALAIDLLVGVTVARQEHVSPSYSPSDIRASRGRRNHGWEVAVVISKEDGAL
jgi:predicted MFS family arabinose efflux permease